MRFYSNKFPKVDDIVFVKFNKTTDQYSVVVNLLEYDYIEGMIVNSEIHRKKVNPEKLFNNRIIPCQVINVNEEKEYVDLSYKRILEEDSKKYQLIYPFIEKIKNFGDEIVELYSMYLKDNEDKKKEEKIFDQTIWKIFEKNNVLTSNLEQLYEKFISDPKALFEYVDTNCLPKDFINRCISNYNKRMRISDITVSNDFKLQILSTGGVEKLKNILLSTIPDHLMEKVKIECISSPKYKLIIVAKDQDEINKILSEIDSIIKNKIKNDHVIYNMDTNTIVLKKKIYCMAPLKSFINFF